MDDIAASDLKTILHSKRANIYYLEHCRVLVNGGRVEYVTDAGKRSLYWNIPIANTTSILLGTGTSITQAAMRELAKAGVLVGFCGGGGTPLFSANEVDIEVAWLSPQSEYRPTEYLQAWAAFWFDEDRRLSAAQALQQARIRRLGQEWRQKGLAEAGFNVNLERLTEGKHPFAAAQAAEKTRSCQASRPTAFAAAQAAEKAELEIVGTALLFAAAQAAEKSTGKHTIKDLLFAAAQAAEKSRYGNQKSSLCSRAHRRSWPLLCWRSSSSAIPASLETRCCALFNAV